MTTEPESIDKELVKIWSKKELYSQKSFDEIFRVEDIPLFWFFKRYLLKHVLPNPLNTYTEAEQGKKLGFLRKLYLQLSAVILSKYIFFHETRKINSSARKKEFTANKKALILTYYDHLQDDGTIYRIQGIIDEFTKNPSITPFPLLVAQLSKAKPPAKIVGRTPGLNDLYQYYDKKLALKAKETSRDILKEWKKLDQATLEKSFKVSKSGLWPYLGPAFSLFMSRDFIYLIILYYELCKKIIEKEQVAIVVLTTQSGLLDRCMIAASRTKKIPCMLVSHGFATKYFTSDNILDNMFFSVFNQTTRQALIDQGVSPEKIRVTGPAVYDNILKYKKKAVKKLFPGKNILILTQPLIEDNQISRKAYFALIRKILEEILKLEEVTVTIKLHPREKSIQTYKQISRAVNGSRIEVLQQGAQDLLYILLKKAEVVINFNATAAIIEASILDKPSITFSKEESYKYKGFDPSLYVKDINSLNLTIEKLLLDPSLLRRERLLMVKEFCSVVDGKASERVVKWCGQLIDKNESDKEETRKREVSKKEAGAGP